METKTPVRPCAGLPFQAFLLFQFKLTLPFPKFKKKKTKTHQTKKNQKKPKQTKQKNPEKPTARAQLLTSWLTIKALRS